MPKEMELEVVTPHGVFISRKVTYINAQGINGGFGILYDHIPLYSVLISGLLEFDDGLRRKIQVNGGVLKCVRNKITVLTSSAEII